MYTHICMLIYNMCVFLRVYTYIQYIYTYIYMYMCIRIYIEQLPCTTKLWGPCACCPRSRGSKISHLKTGLGATIMRQPA